MTLLEQLKALDKAGDAATEGEWDVTSGPCDDSQGDFNCVSLKFTPYHELFEREMTDDKATWDDDENYEFIVTAANSRKAIKDAIARIETQDAQVESEGVDRDLVSLRQENGELAADLEAVFKEMARRGGALAFLVTAKEMKDSGDTGREYQKLKKRGWELAQKIIGEPSKVPAKNALYFDHQMAKILEKK